MRISVRNLRKKFTSGRRDKVNAIDDVSLDVNDGEFLVILGPSGSGKTTLLRCIAGLERPDSGEITIGDMMVFSAERKVSVPAERRGMSMVFQSYGLWPHMSVYQNVAYPLRTAGVSKSAASARVHRALSLVGCDALSERYPSQLSGGQQQRVAVARAVVNDSHTVLFDEPLSSVDALVREELRRELSALQRELGFSAIYITHDQTEATVLGDRVAVLSQGSVLQIASPRELYSRPASRYIAHFLGAPNQYEGTVEAVDGAALRVASELGSVVAATGNSTFAVGDRVTLICRPEHLVISSDEPMGAENAWKGTVESEHFLGICTEYVVRVNSTPILVRSMSQPPLSHGDMAWLRIHRGSVALVPGHD
jgi:iron(III) transport system ATP-binding protein